MFVDIDTSPVFRHASYIQAHTFLTSTYGIYKHIVFTSTYLIYKHISSYNVKDIVML